MTTRPIYDIMHNRNGSTIMNSREITLRVQCDLPGEISVDEFKDYVLETVKRNSPDIFLEDKILASLVVKRTYQRK